jgi:hypothetical protein
MSNKIILAKTASKISTSVSWGAQNWDLRISWHNAFKNGHVPKGVDEDAE